MAINEGTDESIYGAIVAYRLSVTSPEMLRDYLAVTRYREGEGNPPEGPAHASGLLVKDVLAGKANWTSEEVAEFAHWLDSDPHMNAWLDNWFSEIEAAIRNSPVWGSRLVNDD